MCRAAGLPAAVRLRRGSASGASGPRRPAKFAAETGTSGPDEDRDLAFRRERAPVAARGRASEGHRGAGREDRVGVTFR